MLLDILESKAWHVKMGRMDPTKNTMVSLFTNMDAYLLPWEIAMNVFIAVIHTQKTPVSRSITVAFYEKKTKKGTGYRLLRKRTMCPIVVPDQYVVLMRCSRRPPLAWYGHGSHDGWITKGTAHSARRSPLGTVAERPPRRSRTVFAAVIAGQTGGPTRHGR